MCDKVVIFCTGEQIHKTVWYRVLGGSQVSEMPLRLIKFTVNPSVAVTTTLPQEGKVAFVSPICPK